MNRFFAIVLQSTALIIISFSLSLSPSQVMLNQLAYVVLKFKLYCRYMIGMYKSVFVSSFRNK